MPAARPSPGSTLLARGTLGNARVCSCTELLAAAQLALQSLSGCLSARSSGCRVFTSQTSPAPSAISHCQNANRAKRQEFSAHSPRPAADSKPNWEIEFVFFLFGRAVEGLAGRFTFAPRRHGVVDQFTMLALLSMAKLLPAAVLGAPAQPNDVVWFLLADGLESDANWKHSAIRKAASRL